MSRFGAHIPSVQLDDDELRTAFERIGLSRGDRYLELGSGAGRGLLLAARDFDAIASGVEIDPAAVATAQALARAAGVDVHVDESDVLDADLGVPDVVLMHLGPAFHDLMAPRLEQLLPATTRVVTWGWEVPGWIAEPDPPGFTHPCYCYRPADPRMAGVWHAAGSSRTTPPNIELIDAASFRAGADLEHIELRLHGTLASSVTAHASASSLARGQHMLVELRWHHHKDGVYGGSLELWARSRSSRVTARGMPLPLALNVT